MPGPEDLTQRLLWLGATQSLCARAEESGASAEIVELHQNDLSLDSLCHPPKPEFGCSRKRVHRQIRLAGIASVEKPGLQSHHQLPAQPPRRPHSKETSFLSNPIRPGWVISPAFPPERAGLYPAIVKGLCTGKRVGCAFFSPIDTTPTLEAVDRVVRRCTPSQGLIFHSNQASNTPRSPSGNGWRSMESGRACPARAIPTTTPWQGISSAASSAS